MCALLITTTVHAASFDALLQPPFGASSPAPRNFAALAISPINGAPVSRPEGFHGSVLALEDCQTTCLEFADAADACGASDTTCACSTASSYGADCYSCLDKEGYASTDAGTTLAGVLDACGITSSSSSSSTSSSGLPQSCLPDCSALGTAINVCGSDGTDTCYCNAVATAGGDQCLTCTQNAGAGSTEFGTTLEQLVQACQAYSGSSAAATATATSTSSSGGSSNNDIPQSCYSACTPLGTALSPCSDTDTECLCAAVIDNNAGQQCYNCIDGAGAASTSFGDALSQALSICTAAAQTTSGGGSGFTPITGEASAQITRVAISSLPGGSTDAASTSASSPFSENAAGTVDPGCALLLVGIAATALMPF